MKYIKEYKEIDWEDWEYEEYPKMGFKVMKYYYNDKSSYNNYRYFLEKDKLLLKNIFNYDKCELKKFSSPLSEITKEEFDLIKKDIIILTNQYKYTIRSSEYREWRYSEIKDRINISFK